MPKTMTPYSARHKPEKPTQELGNEQLNLIRAELARQEVKLGGKPYPG